MPEGSLNEKARRENSLALAAMLGVTEGRASELLGVSVLLTVDSKDSAGAQLADDIHRLISRTVRAVTFATDQDRFAVEIILGHSGARSEAPQLYVSMSTEAIVIDSNTQESVPNVNVHGLLRLIGACYVVAAALEIALQPELARPATSRRTVRFSELGVNLQDLESPIDLGHAYLAGAGAIGNAFLWATSRLNIRGTLDVVDDDVVSSGNLNRQVFFTDGDVGWPKSVRLVEHARGLLPELSLRAQICRLQDVPEKNTGPWLRRLVVAVDSRRARRQLQSELPGEVFDASTTDTREVIIHHNREPRNTACLECIYCANEAEYTREHHIADSLGISVDEVRRERVTDAAASLIADRFPTFKAEDIVGIAYDSLFKQLCGQALLRGPSGRAILAPFAFVSCLAGALLALEIVRRLAPGAPASDLNYWRVSAWTPPILRLQRVRTQNATCECCSNEDIARVRANLWGA
ncbi:MAG: ThiF family adenylyltransferase [Gemmatimonadota bacterium]